MDNFASRLAAGLSQVITLPDDPGPAPVARMAPPRAGLDASDGADAYDGLDGSDEGGAPAAPAMPKAAAPAATPKTILQLHPFPFPIDIDDYVNAYSASNPTGNYRAAFRLRELADPIPVPGPVYTTSSISTEGTWEKIAKNAEAIGYPYTIDLIDTARRKVQNYRLSGLGGVPDDWYPVATVPVDWAELVRDDANLAEVTIDFRQEPDGTPGLLVLDGSSGPLRWRTEGGSDAGALQQGTQIHSITMKVLYVQFSRPWLDLELLYQNNWGIHGIRAGFYSNGRLENNNGIFPLLKTGMLVGTRLSISGSFADADKSLLADAAASSRPLAFGSLQLSDERSALSLQEDASGRIDIRSDIRQIYGFTSSVVPRAPWLAP